LDHGFICQILRINVSVVAIITLIKSSIFRMERVLGVVHHLIQFVVFGLFVFILLSTISAAALPSLRRFRPSTRLLSL